MQVFKKRVLVQERSFLLPPDLTQHIASYFNSFFTHYLIQFSFPFHLSSSFIFYLSFFILIFLYLFPSTRLCFLHCFFPPSLIFCLFPFFFSASTDCFFIYETLPSLSLPTVNYWTRQSKHTPLFCSITFTYVLRNFLRNQITPEILTHCNMIFIILKTPYKE
jgi:hypothetical protein